MVRSLLPPQSWHNARRRTPLQSSSRLWNSVAYSFCSVQSSAASLTSSVLARKLGPQRRRGQNRLFKTLSDVILSEFKSWFPFALLRKGEITAASFSGVLSLVSLPIAHPKAAELACYSQFKQILFTSLFLDHRLTVT